MFVEQPDRQDFFAIVNGSYEGYDIVALFPTRKLAEEHMEVRGDKKDGLATYTLFNRAPYRLVYYQRSCFMSKLGSALDEREHAYSVYEYEPQYEAMQETPAASISNECLDDPVMGHCYIIEATGHDKEGVARVYARAVEEAREKLIKIYGRKRDGDGEGDGETEEAGETGETTPE